MSATVTSGFAAAKQALCDHFNSMDVRGQQYLISLVGIEVCKAYISGNPIPELDQLLHDLQRSARRRN